MAFWDFLRRRREPVDASPEAKRRAAFKARVGEAVRRAFIRRAGSGVD